MTLPTAPAATPPAVRRRPFVPVSYTLLQAGPPVGQLSAQSTAIQVIPHAINPAPAATRPTPAGVFHERDAGSSGAMIGTGQADGPGSGRDTGAPTATAARFSTGSSTIATDTLAPPAIVTVFEKFLKPGLFAVTTARPSASLAG